MHRTEGANNDNGLFSDGPPGTVIDSDWLNSVQEELINTIEYFGGEIPSAADDSQDQLKAALIAAIHSASPSGVVQSYMGETIPNGWLECDGAAVSRATYSNLFEAIGVIYGNGDGTTTFNLPDLRGRFLRGHDDGAGTDPDAATRTDRGDGTGGDNVGTKQADAMQGHYHDGYAASGGGGAGFTIQSNPNAGVSADKFTAGSIGSPITDGTNGVPRTTSETRPININVKFIIKY